MSRQISELETILQQMLEEHRKLLVHVDKQQVAMKKLDLVAMEASAKLQEGSRLRISTLETKRKTLVLLLARTMKIEGELTIQKLAELNPPHRDVLLKLRDELKSVAGAVAARTHVGGRLAGAVLGHLNTAVRLLAGAVERAGVYTKNGIPKVSARIGVMEAVG